MRIGRRTADAVDDVVAELRRRAMGGQFVWSERRPPEPGRWSAPARALPEALQQALQLQGIARLYAHQAEAIDRIRAGEDAVIVTPTASGKTLAFNLPVLERLLDDPQARSVYVYPTNALANDQERALRALNSNMPRPLSIGLLTGATDLETRRRLRATPPRILLTNPEMLHLSLLGAHRSWARFWPGVRFFVLDELHLYRGLFGTNMAMVTRRALRVAGHHGAFPQVIGCSATVGNPDELLERLTGRRAAVIEGTGAARGARTLVVWRPRALTAGDDDERANAQTEAVNLFCYLISEGMGTILFAPTRRSAEEMSIEARSRLGSGPGNRIAPYRSGYTAEQRRAIEVGLKSGELAGVVATNALEVGIDIGGLDAAVLSGFPGSRNSFWQQAGRAGRGTRSALVVFVPYPRPVDGYYTAHPEALLADQYEDAIVDLGNVEVAAAHLPCAAAEMRLSAEEAATLSPVSSEALGRAQDAGRIVRTGDGWGTPSEPDYRAVSLRGGADLICRIVGPFGEVGTIDGAHLFREAFPGAVYVHGGERLRVTALDMVQRRVEVVPEPRRLRTDPRVDTTVHIEKKLVDGQFLWRSAPVRLGSGRLQVRQTTSAYRERPANGRGTETTVPLAAPLAYEVSTTGTWVVFPDELRALLERDDRLRFLEGLHGLEHLLPAAVSLRILCDARDVVATYEITHAGLAGPTLFLFDDCSGGAGVAERTLPLFGDLLRLCLNIVRDCACRDGCPACVLSSACWRPREEVSKGSTFALLQALLDEW